MCRKLKTIFSYFSTVELLLWSVSVLLITVFFFLFDRENYMTLTASILGATSLILNAKGNPLGQFLMVIFSVLYGMISYSFHYYGEMITYLGMTAPMAVFALFSWLKNPYGKNHAEVKINRIKRSEVIFMILLTAMVTLLFSFILKAFDTANLALSTLSVTTSFLAVYLTFRRSRYFAIAYAANDIVLIFLWILATLTDLSYLSVTICFLLFLVHDIYGFINWTSMQKRQEQSPNGS